MSALPKPASTSAVKHLVVFNMAAAILKVRHFDDVVAKAVRLTQDKTQRNKTRKIFAKVEAQLERITSFSSTIFSQFSRDDLERVKKGHNAGVVSLIPETTTNPEILALYMLFINFQDCPDKKLDKRFDILQTIDYMELIITISEEIGLEQDVSEDMYLLALKLIEEMKR